MSVEDAVETRFIVVIVMGSQFHDFELLIFFQFQSFEMDSSSQNMQMDIPRSIEDNKNSNLRFLEKMYKSVPDVFIFLFCCSADDV